MLLLNLAIGYALLSLHGLVHAPPLILTRLVASAQDTATDEDPAEVAEEGRDEWDVAEDLLAAHERGVEEGHPAVGGGGGLDETIEGHVDVTLVTQTSPERLWMVEPLSHRWEGAISLALYLPESTKEKVLAPFRKWHGSGFGPAKRVALTELQGRGWG